MRRTLLLAWLAVPAWACAAAAAAPEREPRASRYAIGEAALEREGDLSANGRFRMSGALDTVSVDAKPARGARYAVVAKLATDADCSDVILADSYE